MIRGDSATIPVIVVVVVAKVLMFLLWLLLLLRFLRERKGAVDYCRFHICNLYSLNELNGFQVSEKRVKINGYNDLKERKKRERKGQRRRVGRGARETGKGGRKRQIEREKKTQRRRYRGRFWTKRDEKRGRLKEMGGEREHE